MPLPIQIKRYLFKAALALTLNLFLVSIQPGHALAEEAAALEYRIKAAYLYNFTKFIAWPESTRGNGDHFTIAILGEDPFGDTLTPLTQKSVHGRPIKIVRLDDPQSVPEADLLFLANQDADEIKTILTRIQDRATLTIGESPAFTRSGGMIGFYSERKKIRFEINTEATRRKGFSVSSQLLKLARIVDGATP